MITNCKGVILINGNIIPGMIKIGFATEIVGIFNRKKSKGILSIAGKMVFYGKASIGHGVKISVGKTGILELGQNFIISAETSIACFKKISFGKDCLISWDVLFMDTDFHRIIDINNNVVNEAMEILIGDHVWIGCRCLILKGSIVKDGCVIGANSLVHGELGHENSVYVGNPLKCVRMNISWEI